jgi:type II secretory pathway pseudopilin PulG
MRALIIAVTALAMISVASTAAFPQQKPSVRDMMTEMKAKYGQTFEQCQALATSRGYRLSDDEFEGRLVMMFIEGCIMGRQR